MTPVWVQVLWEKGYVHMYIKKAQYYILKIISGFGTYFWGFLFWAMIFGMLMDVTMGNDDFINTDIPSITMGLFTFWIAHCFLRYWIGKLKIYNSIFANDADGFIQAKVVAKALGFTEEKVISDIRFLCKMFLFKNIDLQKDNLNSMVIVLGNNERNEMNKAQKRIVICPNCGAENDVRPGFVAACRYCSGSLEEGEGNHVSK